MFVLHEETDSATAFATTKAFIDAFGRGDVEGGCFLVMEGTTANMIGAALFELDEFTDDFLYTSRIHNALYGFLIDHRICKITKVVRKNQNIFFEQKKAPH